MLCIGNFSCVVSASVGRKADKADAEFSRRYELDEKA